MTMFTRPRWILGAFVTSICLATQASGQDLSIDVQRKVLDNGVTVLVWERPSAGRIGARSFYKVDVAAERQGTIGLVHMLEHHLFKGTDLAGTRDWEAERPIAERVERLERMITDEENHHRDCLVQREVFAELEADCSAGRLDTLRAELVDATTQQNALADTTWYSLAMQSSGGTGSTASTGRDWMKFDIDLPANKLELFMWTERARVENPVFRHFEPEKEVVVDQIRRYDNNPDGKFSRVLRSMTYDAHPYGYAHWFSDLTRATREDHWEIFYKYFIPQNTVLVIVGDIAAETVFEMAEAYWGSWQKGRPSPRLRTVEPEPVGQKRLVVEAAAGPAVAVNVLMPAVGHDDAHGFDVLAELLGGPRGRLAALLVEEQDIATEASASGWTSKYPSHFEIRVNTRSNDQLEAAEAGINTVLADIASGNVSAAEIEAAANRLILNLARNLEEIGRGAVTIGAMEAIYGWEHLNDLPVRWSTVTAEDLGRIVRRYFDSNIQVVGHLRREDAADAAQRDAGTAGTPVDAAYTAGPNAGRPADWPVGGPVDEFFLAPREQAPAAALQQGADAAGAGELRRYQQKGMVGLNDSQAAPGHSGNTSTIATTSRATPQDSDYAEPLGIAEQPWYTPPWMAERRAARFATPAPTVDYRDLSYPAAELSFPEATDFRVALNNGLNAFVAADPLLPVVQVSVLIDAPVTANPAGKAGLAALTAALLRTGTAPGAEHTLEDALNAMGARLDIDSDRNGTRLHAVAPAAAAGSLVELLGPMLAQPNFATHFEAERERHALRAERAGDDALYAVQALFDEALYGNEHPLGARPSPDSVRSISLDDVRDFHAAHYTARRMSVVITGDIDRDAMVDALRRSEALTTLSAGNEGLSVEIPAPRQPEDVQLVTHDLPTRQGLITLGHLGIEGTPEDHAALELMHHILAGGGFTSRMMTLMRSETGVTSALYGEVEPGRGVANPYQWRFGGNVETLAVGIEQAIQEITRMRDHGVSADEFEAARSAYIDGLIPASYDTTHKTLERLAHNDLYGRYAYQSLHYLNFYAGDQAQIDTLRSLTVDDVNRAARKYLDPDNLVIAIAGQLDLIRAGAPVSVKELLDW